MKEIHHYYIEVLDRNGGTMQTHTICCAGLSEAQKIVRCADGEAVLIRRIDGGKTPVLSKHRKAKRQTQAQPAP
jgi:hypothetical protein